MVALQASLFSFQALIKVALMENVFRAVLFPVSVGAVSEPGTGGAGKREVMPPPCWTCHLLAPNEAVSCGPWDVRSIYQYFSSLFKEPAKSQGLCVPCHVPTRRNPQSAQLSEVLWFSHGTWGQERKTPASGDAGWGRSEPFTSHAHRELTQKLTGFKGLTSVRVV